MIQYIPERNTKEQKTRGRDIGAYLLFLVSLALLGGALLADLAAWITQ